MTINAGDLLRVLGSGVRPDGASLGAGARPPIEGLDFASLLRRAETGSIGSGREVTLPAGIELSEESKQRLAAAADAAEASGARTLLAVVGGSALLVDVATRIASHAAPGPGGVVTAIDAAVSLDAPPTDSAPGPIGAAGPRGFIANRFVADALAGALGGPKPAA